MRKWVNTVTAVYVIVFLLLLASSSFCGVTGKISGVVIDEATQDPIVGARITVAGTDYQIYTDMDGEYFIINLPGGKYDLQVSYMGFETVLKKDVRVLVDLTTSMDFNLNPAPIELGQVIVTASNPVIQKDLTGTKIIFTSDNLKNLPNVVSVQSILTNYPGVVADRNNSLHVRGGRSGQITYYYDGFNIQDPFVSNAGMHIIPTSLEELSLSSGGYTAEYGEALSGVVNAITREGSSLYHGGIKMYEGATHPYDVNTGTLNSLDRIGNRSFTFDLSGPIPGFNPKKYNFFVTGEYFKNPTYLPMNEQLSKTGTGKLTFQPGNRTKLKTIVSYNDQHGHIYDHRDVNNISYDFNLDGLPKFEKNAYLIGFSGDYAFNERFVMTASVNQFYTKTKAAPDKLFDTYWKDWPGYSEDANGVYNGTIHQDNYLGDPDYSDPSQIVGFTTGDDFVPRYSFREAKYSAFSFNVINQINKWNQIKTGFEYRQEDTHWDNKQFYNTNPYGEIYDSKPEYVSLYLQDKMEYDYFIINLGLRYDYRNSDLTYNITPREFEPTYKKADSKSRISPRLGVSFPISEKTVMHFNYGLYYQTPLYYYMNTNLQGDITSGLPLLGNPDLEPEETISYELGLNHLIGDAIRLNVTAYYKDIQDLVTTRSSYKVAGNSVTYFDNDDYGSAKGIDLSIEKLPNSSNFSGSISYSYMTARGIGSDAMDPYYTYLTSITDTLSPVREYALDFDQRHTINAVMSYRVPSDWQADLFGMGLPGAWGVTMVGNYGSGLPYTPTDDAGNRLGDLNEGRLPATYSVDMRFNKDFSLRSNNMSMSFFVEVDNLFNRRNVINVYSRTGLANNDGINNTASLGVSQEDLDYYDDLYDNDPQNYSPPRTIRTGLQLTF